MTEFAPIMGEEFAEWLVVKTKEEGWNKMDMYEGLTLVNKEGKTALSQMGIQQWSEVSMWKTSKKGLFFSIDNIELKEAIQVWSRAILSNDEEETEKEAALIRQCIQEKGAVVKLSNDLRTAVERWNEKNKDFCEY